MLDSLLSLFKASLRENNRDIGPEYNRRRSSVRPMNIKNAKHKRSTCSECLQYQMENQKLRSKVAQLEAQLAEAKTNASKATYAGNVYLPQHKLEKQNSLPMSMMAEQTHTQLQSNSNGCISGMSNSWSNGNPGHNPKLRRIQSERRQDSSSRNPRLSSRDSTTSRGISSRSESSSEYGVQKSSIRRKQNTNIGRNNNSETIVEKKESPSEKFRNSSFRNTSRRSSSLTDLTEENNKHTARERWAGLKARKSSIEKLQTMSVKTEGRTGPSGARLAMRRPSSAVGLSEHSKKNISLVEVKQTSVNVGPFQLLRNY